MVTTRQKPIANPQKINRKECKHTTKESHQTFGKRAREKERNYRDNQKRLNKMAISTYCKTTFIYCLQMKEQTESEWM